MKNQSKDKITVYIPDGAKININATSQDPPNTIYNNRQKNIDIESVKKIVGGKYGRQDK